MPTSTDTRVIVHPITDRAFWTRIRTDDRAAPFRDALLARSARASASPPVVNATDFLAAKRSNDRARLDHVWQVERATFTALIFRRCLLGLDSADPDDTLLDWLWSLLVLPTWAVSAHLPGHDLPDLARPVLDLASCEMAALLAETRQTLKPWMDTVSNTLADSLVTEIDRRVLQPYADGAPVWWDNTKGYVNNWAGVCAGTILAACESLAAQGQPRPQARARALACLKLFLEQAFTESGECDEGVSYWNYGVGMACLGWSRLSQADLAATVDAARLKAVADYPRRAHLFGDSFYTANDGGLESRAAIAFVPWLAVATGSEWLDRWARRAPAIDCRHFGQVINALDALDRGLVSAAPDPAIDLAAPPGTQWLPDQQAGIIRVPSPGGTLLVTLAGGHNAERHNHNDLGHFMVALDGQWIIPDLGAPHYATDFFGLRRYTYLAASSRGHCCPLINGQEQRAGHEAAGRLLRWDPDGRRACLELDLTTAYPVEAGLREWNRRLERRDDHAVLTDAFQTAKANTPVTEVLWSLAKPVIERGDTVRLGRLAVGLSPAPVAVRVTAVNPADHALRDYQATIYRVEADFVTDTTGHLAARLDFHAR